MSERQPTVLPQSANDFSEVKDAEALNKAFAGFGTNEEVVTNILSHRSLDQRESIQDAYKDKYKKDLLTDLKSEVSGDYGRALEGLLEPPQMFHAKYLNCVLNNILPCSDKGVAVLEVLCPLSNLEINVVAGAFEQVAGKTLLDAVIAQVKGPFKDAVVSFVKNGRTDAVPNVTKINADAAYLTNLPAEQWTPVNTQLMDMLLKNNNFYLFSLFQAFSTANQQSIIDVVGIKPEAQFTTGFKAIVGAAYDSYQFFADQLYTSMKGIGTNEAKLIYIIVFRCEMDLGNIKQAFEEKYKTSLAEVISGDTSGDFKNLLLALVGPEPEAAGQGSATTGS